MLAFGSGELKNVDVRITRLARSTLRLLSKAALQWLP